MLLTSCRSNSPSNGNKAILIHTVLTLASSVNGLTHELFPDFLRAQNLEIIFFNKHYTSGTELGDGVSTVSNIDGLEAASG